MEQKNKKKKNVAKNDSTMVVVFRTITLEFSLGDNLHSTFLGVTSFRFSHGVYDRIQTESDFRKKKGKRQSCISPKDMLYN